MKYKKSNNKNKICNLEPFHQNFLSQYKMSIQIIPKIKSTQEISLSHKYDSTKYIFKLV